MRCCLVSLGFSVPSPIRLGVIDVGSNSTHLFVVDIEEDGTIRTIAHDREQLRLTEFKGADNSLESTAVNQVSAILKNMRQHAEALGAKVRAVGTFAIRDADNWPTFCERVRRRSGIDIEVVSGIEEARLIHLGVLQGVKEKERAILVLDIGGGSAEIVVGRCSEILFSASLKLGSVRLTRRFLKSDPLTHDEVSKLQNYIDERISPVCTQIRRAGFELAIVSGGTAKALAALISEQRGESALKEAHGYTFSASDTAILFSKLLNARSVKERRSIAGMDSKRADVILAGAMVLDALTRMACVPSWTISSSAVREGVIVDSVSREQFWKVGSTDDVRWKSVRSLGEKFEVDSPHSWHIVQLALSIFDGFFLLHTLGPGWREYMRAAAYLHEVGMFIDYSAYHKHSYYIVHNTPISGFGLRERDIIASIIRFHRKRVPLGHEDELQDLRENEREAVKLLSGILRLCVTLDHTRQGLVNKVEVTESRNGVGKIRVSRHASSGIARQRLEADKSHLESVLGIKLDLFEAH